MHVLYLLTVMNHVLNAEILVSHKNILDRTCYFIYNVRVSK